jgi:hypothetical protein
MQYISRVRPTTAGLLGSALCRARVSTWVQMMNDPFTCSLFGDNKEPMHTCMCRNILTCSLKLAISSLYPAGGGERCAAGAPDRCSMAASCTAHRIHTHCIFVRMKRRVYAPTRVMHKETRAHKSTHTHTLSSTYARKPAYGYRHGHRHTPATSAHVHVRACVRACVHGSVCARVYVCVCVRARLSLWELACAHTSTWA